LIYFLYDRAFVKPKLKRRQALEHRKEEEMEAKPALQEKGVLCQRLRDRIGRNKVKDDENVLATYGFDASPVPFRRPSAVVMAENREDVKETLKIADGYKVPVTIMSAGVNVGGMAIPLEGGILLDLRRMDNILEINTDSGYAVIEPGVMYDKFTAALAEKGFRGFVSTSPGGSSVVANYLMRPSGSLPTRHLDPILDLEVVFPDGSIINTGSSHFPSVGSSMRYGPFPDLAGLFCCAYGTLGVVTRAAVRIYPVNESGRVVIAGFDNFERSTRYVKDLVDHNVAEHGLVWHWQLYRAFEITFADGWIPQIPPELFGDPLQPPAGVPYNIVNILMSGYEESMITQEKVCDKVAKKYGGRIFSREEAQRVMPGAVHRWDENYLKYHQVMSKNFATGRYFPYLVMGEPEAICELEPYVVKKLDSLGVRPVAYYSMPFDFGRSVFFRAFIYPDPANKELLKKTAETMKEMYEEAMRRYGVVPFRHRPGLTWQHQTGDYYKFLKKIKQVVDPNNILNPHMGLF
jgi:FAD/FMN-containing dehydrogenase